MKIWLTRPNQAIHPLEVKLIERWIDKVAKPRGAQYKIMVPFPYEIHGELLTRIWNEIRQDSEEIHLISESDFFIHREGEELDHILARLKKWNRAAFFCAFGRRDPPDFKFTHLEPLVAPWFMIFNKPAFKVLPRLDWLSASGPFNDAANLAYCRAAEDGAFFRNQVIFGEGVDPDGFRGISYDFGTHLMWLRHWHNPDDVIFPDGYTVTRHLEGVSCWLKPRGIRT